MQKNKKKACIKIPEIFLIQAIYVPLEFPTQWPLEAIVYSYEIEA